SLPGATSHSLTVLSTPAEARVVPSGLQETDNTPSVCPLRTAFSWPVCGSHSLTVLSMLAEASVLPSGLYATARTQPVCPLRVARSRPVATSHSLTTLSSSPGAGTGTAAGAGAGKLSPYPEASVLPSGAHATASTPPARPPRGAVSL